MFEYKYGAENIVWGYSIMKKSGLKYTNMKQVEEMGILSIYLLESFVPRFQIQHRKWTICGLTSAWSEADVPHPQNRMGTGKQGSWVLRPVLFWVCLRKAI